MTGELNKMAAETETDVRAGAGGLLANLLRTTGFCLIVALVLVAIGVSSFVSALIVSLCIGYGITGVFHLLATPLEQRLGPLSPVLLIPIGVLTGLAVAGTIRSGDPLALIYASPGTLIMCLALGVIGYQVVGNRMRLLNSRVRIAELERSQAQQRQQLADTRLKLLQAQIEPHFLFNTLGNVQSLIATDPERAARMLEQFTALLRHSLARTRDAETSLAEEAELLRAYLEIQAERTGGRLSYTIDIPAELATATLPPLLLQPLVENAVTHGLEPQPGEGLIKVSAQRAEERLLLSVADNGAGLDDTAEQPRGTGTALRNIRARLSERYGDQATLRLLENSPQGLRAELSLPLVFVQESS